MASRTAKIASSIVAGVLAGVPLAAPRNAANAAECLTEPGKDGTHGQHWYYRIEHGTKRHCWYLRDGDGKAVQTGSESADDSTETPKAAAENNENPSRSVEDARAEYPMPRGSGNTVAVPATAPTSLPASNPVPVASSQAANPPQADDQGSAVASRWPSPETAAAPGVLTATAPAAPPPAAPQVVADAAQPAPATNTAARAPAETVAPVPAIANTAPAKPSVSLQMLFAVIGGALALAGLTGSVVYRFGRRKQRRLATPERRAVLWEGVENGPRPPWVPPEVEEEAPPAPPPQRRPARSAKVQPERYEKIEEILAQLVKQGQQSDA
jgi:hypothetical protein